MAENVLEAVVRQLTRIHMEHARSGAVAVLGHMVQLRAIAEAVERGGTDLPSPPHTPPETEAVWLTWWTDPPPPPHTHTAYTHWAPPQPAHN